MDLHCERFPGTVYYYYLVTKLSAEPFVEGTSCTFWQWMIDDRGWSEDGLSPPRLSTPEGPHPQLRSLDNSIYTEACKYGKYTWEKKVFELIICFSDHSSFFIASSFLYFSKFIIGGET